MKIGIKFYPEHIEGILKAGMDMGEISEKGDFVEILAVPGADYSFLEGIACPVTVHMDHHSGNLCDPTGLEGNRKTIDAAVKLADRVGSKVIVIHGGWMTKPECNLENTIKMMKEMFDKRMHIEDLPFREKGKGFTGRTPEEIKRVMQETGCRFCLDFSHASASAYGLGKDYMGFVKSFLPLKPSYFHMHDSIIKTELCKHMHLGDGELDIKAFKAMMPEDAWVCLETLGGHKGLDLPRCFEDVEFLRKL
ncbi:MAG: TIM barrel protein [Candidatus Aenigmarchaeota archaeon]